MRFGQSSCTSATQEIANESVLFHWWSNTALQGTAVVGRHRDNVMEYRSGVTFLGLPLVHIASGRIANGVYRRGIATGWVAVGDIAIGVFVSCGAIAVGGISIGGASLGLLSIGGLAVGLIALGGLSVGLLALGGAAFAWYAALGGLAVAHHYALGGAAFGEHIASPLAPEFRAKYPHPEAPFRTEDALWLLAIVVALLFLARRIQRWRMDKE